MSESIRGTVFINTFRKCILRSNVLLKFCLYQFLLVSSMIAVNCVNVFRFFFMDQVQFVFLFSIWTNIRAINRVLSFHNKQRILINQHETYELGRKFLVKQQSGNF